MFDEKSIDVTRQIDISLIVFLLSCPLSINENENLQNESNQLPSMFFVKKMVVFCCCKPIRAMLPLFVKDIN